MVIEYEESQKPPKKRRRPDPFWISTDGEWQLRTWISQVFASERGVVLYLLDDIPEAIKARVILAAAACGAIVVFTTMTDQTCLLQDYLNRLKIKNKEIRLLHYFSAKDVEYACGWDNFKRAIDEKKVDQRANLSGVVRIPGGRKVRIKDLYGWANKDDGKGKLVKFATSLGIPMVNKDSMDTYKKGHMLDGLLEMPEDFVSYAVDDARVLLELHAKFIEHFRGLQRDCLGMPEDKVMTADEIWESLGRPDEIQGTGDKLWTKDDIPMTVGRLVSETLERWIYHRAATEGVEGKFRFAIRKFGVLDSGAKRYQYHRGVYQRVVDAVRLGSGEGLHANDFDEFFKAKFTYTALDACSVGWFAARDNTDTAIYNALVQGGRCANENPYDCEIGRGCDVDIAGCYGGAIRELIYPVGLPTVFSFTNNQPRPSFGEWFDTHKADLVDGLWTSTVTGKLSSEQDLIFSKVLGLDRNGNVKEGDIRKAAKERDDLADDEVDGSDIPSNFLLIRGEIVNGIINSDVLDKMKKPASCQAWADIRNHLSLVTAVVYRRSDQVPTIKAWCEEVATDRGFYHRGDNGLRDCRTRSWTAIPLEEFVGKLVDRRLECKKRGEKGMSEILKLTINVVYGVMASRFFDISNVVVANNITARARVGVWMAAKALGTRQSITDGGPYSPWKVNFFRGKKPGLDILSRLWEWDDPRRGRTVGMLPGFDPASPFPSDRESAEFDRLVMEHVTAFWEPYGLKFPFHLKHKDSFLSAALWGKADYAFRRDPADITPDDPEPIRYKCRGRKRDARVRHPIYTILDAILDGRDDFPETMECTHTSLLKIGKYREIQKRNGYADLKGLRPGDEWTQDRRATFNNLHFPLHTLAEFRRREKRGRRTTARDEPFLLFERYAAWGIAAVLEQMARDQLRG